MFSNVTLKATLAAEKEKEKVENRLAARYVRIRALLDEAERAINTANIARSLKNQLISKVLKARRALDKGLNVDEVIEMMTLVVTIINNHIKEDKKAVELTTSEMRKNLDTFYKYDFDKFLRSESSSRPQSPDRLTEITSSNEARRSRSRSGDVALPSPARSPIRSNRLCQEAEKVASPKMLPSDSSTGSRCRRENNLHTLREERPTMMSEAGYGTNIEDASAGPLSSKRDETIRAGIDSLDEDGDKGELTEDSVKNQSLKTLIMSLTILHEIPHLRLNKDVHDHLGATLRATKPLLLTAEGCSALSGPLNMLKSAIDCHKTDGKPKEPLFTQALVELNTVITSFDIAGRKLAETYF